MNDVGVCALVAASDFNAEDFLARREAGEFDAVIAVDAGYAHLERIGVMPDVSLGDFDSLGYKPKKGRVVAFPPEKDKSDLELGFERACRMRHDEVIVYGALGGRLDHTLANLQLFARFSEKGLYVTAVGEREAIRALTGPDVLELPALDSGTVSVFSFSDRAQGVIETGMRYSFDDEPLTNRTSRGLSNELWASRPPSPWKAEPCSYSIRSASLSRIHKEGRAGCKRSTLPLLFYGR